MIRSRRSSNGLVMPDAKGGRAVVIRVEGGEVYEVSPRLGAMTAPHSAVAEAFHRMAREIINRHLSWGRRGLALCGASAGTGVTFAAANLAVALAQLGVPTLLVEANFRRPDLHRLIRPQNETIGLQQLLRSEADLEGVVHREAFPNLSLIFAGGSAPDADQLVVGEQFRHVLHECMREHGCTIVDTPAANRYADARAIAATVGYAAVVGRRNFTFLDDATLLAEQLAQDGVQVVGSIFNGV